MEFGRLKPIDFIYNEEPLGLLMVKALRENLETVSRSTITEVYYKVKERYPELCDNYRNIERITINVPEIANFILSI